MAGFYALHFGFLGIDRPQLACIVAAQKVAQDGAARFVDVVGSAYDNDAFRMEQLGIDHNGGMDG